mmetsp:Transcript_42557/g.31159  ORF Transcript_42557/g.31159 Transcript_42557/m.31159 type:complete len:214 (+) Transcript_42557:324-965(+)
MNCLEWAPWEYGLILAAGSADGKIYIFNRMADDSWTHNSVQAHNGGINALSWGPSTEPSILSQEHQSAHIDNQQFALPPKRLVSAGNDCKIIVWHLKEHLERVKDDFEHEHQDWVRDVAWANNIGLTHETIASCSEDNKVKIWRNTNPANPKEWQMVKEVNLGVPAWKVSWSLVGNMLAVSGGDNQVQILKENSSGDWEVVSKVNEEGELQDL